MNYHNHYNKLIERAKNRTIDSYTENHHIIPSCIGGTDNSDNLVRLTAREHFIAHILLVKIYPKEDGLINAVNIMCISNNNQTRVHNRMYGWLKEKFAKNQSVRQTGKGNSQYGKYWVTNIHTKKTIRIKSQELENFLSHDYIRGKKSYNCWCGKPIKNISLSIKFCSKECKTKKLSENNPFKGKHHSKESIEKISNAKKGQGSGKANSQYGTIWINNGIKNKKIKKDNNICEGWKKGKH